MLDLLSEGLVSLLFVVPVVLLAIPIINYQAKIDELKESRDAYRDEALRK